jgi:protein-S-isoprenylcysteine O-methyltransferase Ste14
VEIKQRELKRAVLLRFLGLPFVLGIIFFLPANTLRYWEAWIYILVLTIPMLWAALYLLRHDPALMERRMRMKEKETAQINLQRWIKIIFLFYFLIPGLDRRFGWSDVPLALVVVSMTIVLAGYCLFVWVLKNNSYLSRTVEVDEDQRLITTGPYAIVRHPMYFAFLLIVLFSPMALDSYWPVLLFVPILIIIVIRLNNEEVVMLRDLSGYREYMDKTPYRLIPGIW